VFVYRFDWETQAMGGHMRAMHVLEVPFVMDNTIRSAALVGTPADAEALAASISTAWTTFARTGAPAAAGLPKWPAYSPANRKVMVFNTQSFLGDDPGGAERRALLTALGS
jgi:para-nitrobenzyl esterase